MTEEGHRAVGIIPAHLASVRFPRKILHEFHGLPMIEHVRRRALMAEGLRDVYVATCDTEIATAVEDGGGKVILTGNHHRNGTSRVAEAVQNIEASHVVLLQGDEPLLLPRHLEALLRAMRLHADADAWNATGDILEPSELDRHSFVKCSIGVENRILYCFRRSPSMATFDIQTRYIRKILGLFAFTRETLLSVADAAPSVVETHESIEQMRIIETGRKLISVPVDVALPSVNETHEVTFVENAIRNNKEQQDLLDRVLSA